ncbi:YpmS family protein [Salibacterium sp. K-3]
MQKQVSNKWKWAFFILAGGLFLSFVLLFFWISSPVGDDDPAENRSEDFQEYFTMQATRNQLNQLLQEEIDSEQAEVRVAGETVRVSAGIDFLGRSIEAVMEFEAEAVENGDMLLTLRDVSVGSLSLPGPQAMSLLASQAELPEAAEIHAKQQQIRIRMNEVTVGNGYSLRLEQFQPEEDQIIIKVGK